eukprot:TRINITY_DN8895_c0_g1_i1.p1 TRINITY_DN8895_c0_g1~~TRINITY_DN8895_c0_g1_i1.p1  ORF type:complete len:473 (-),score=105.02 TRINITY_DN8895_c0_g1_i1:167-1492(-)
MAPKAKGSAHKRPISTAASKASCDQPPHKRLASATAVAAVRAAIPSGGHGSRDNNSIVLLTPRKYFAIINALEGVEELPKSVKPMLAELLRRSWEAPEGLAQQFQEPLVRLVSASLQEVESRLREDFRQWNAIVEDGDAVLAERESGVEMAEARLHDLKQAVKNRHAELEAAVKALHKSREERRSREKDCRREEATSRAVTAQFNELHATETNTYQVLKQAAAVGEEAQKGLTALRRVGKHFGFHEVLLDTLPSVLKTKPEKRRTFDDIALKQLEVEFAKHISDREAEMKKSLLAVRDHQARVHDARAAVRDAEAEREAKTKEITRAEKEVEAGKAALKEARKKLRRFCTDVRSAPKNLAKAEKRLNSFIDGPLIAFKELCQATSTTMKDKSNGESASSTERQLPVKDAVVAVAAPLPFDKVETPPPVTIPLPDADSPQGP